MSDPVEIAANAYELALILGGLILSWRLVASPTARARRRPAAVKAWDAPISDFLLFLLLIMAGTVVVASISGGWARRLMLGGDATAIFNTAAGQIGMLLGIALYHFLLRPNTGGNIRVPFRIILRGGLATFLISMPFLALTGFVWQGLLKLAGQPIERQDLIGMFAHADSAWILTIMIVLATVTAPLTEELVFRAGLFRYFRTRLPRLAALLLPAVMFATLHLNLASFAQLVVLAVIFSIAYERTGHIGTTIIAHALFNLNTIILIFCGVGL
jgi:membrane protease YdiL (CAAX protease family)